MNIRLNSNDMTTAWLLDTLGKSKVTGSVKRTILNVSIPGLCERLQSNGDNIRYNSKILRGISLMYALKIDYFIDDMKMLNSKIFRDLSYCTRKSLTNTKPPLLGDNLTKVGKKKMFQDDPLFNIFVDLIPSLAIEFDSRKRKRQSTTDEDFETFVNSAIITLKNSKYDQKVDDFIDQDFDLSFNESSSQFSFHQQNQLLQQKQQENCPDFIFNSEGGINMVDNQPDFDFDNENHSLDIDLDEFKVDGIGIQDENNLLNENGASISRDEYFAISTLENQQSILINKIRKLRNYRLVVDPTNKFSNTQLHNFSADYNNVKRRTNKQASHPFKMKKIYQEYNQVPPYISYCQRAIFGKKYETLMEQLDSRTLTDDNDISTINREIDLIRKLQNIPDMFEFEIGRNFQKPQLLQHDVYEEVLGLEPSIERSDDIDEDVINISFGNIDQSSQINSSLYQYHNQQEPFFDDNLPIILDNIQLTKYYNFLVEHQGSIDVNSKFEYQFNLSNQQTNARYRYKKIRLRELIPDSASSEYPISKKLAVRSFSSLLTLASKYYIAIDLRNQPIRNQFNDLNDIDIIIPIILE